MVCLKVIDKGGKMQNRMNTNIVQRSPAFGGKDWSDLR